MAADKKPVSEPGIFHSWDEVDAARRRFAAEHGIKVPEQATKDGPTGFTPSEDQIRCAQTLMVAMAYEGTLRPIVEGYQCAILAKHQFKQGAKWGERVGPDGGVILEGKHAFLLEDEDFQVYLDECKVAQDAHGLKASKPENCPLLEAESARMAAEHALLKTWEGHPRLSSLAAAGTLRLEQRAQVIELTLGLLAPYVKDNARDMLAEMGIQAPEPKAAAPISSPEP